MTTPTNRRPIEDQVERALADTARRNYPTDLLPPPFVPPVAVARHRVRWLVPALAAAAVIVIVITSVAVAAVVGHHSRPRPAVTSSPSPSPTSSSPIETTSPSPTPSSSEPSSTQPTTSQPAPAAWYTGVDFATRLTTQCGLTITIDRQWVIAQSSGGEPLVVVLARCGSNPMVAELDDGGVHGRVIAVEVVPGSLVSATLDGAMLRIHYAAPTEHSWDGGMVLYAYALTVLDRLRPSTPQDITPQCAAEQISAAHPFLARWAKTDPYPHVRGFWFHATATTPCWVPKTPLRFVLYSASHHVVFGPYGGTGVGPGRWYVVDPKHDNDFFIINDTGFPTYDKYNCISTTQATSQQVTWPWGVTANYKIPTVYPCAISAGGYFGGTEYPMDVPR